VETHQKTTRQQPIKSHLDNSLDKTFHCNSEGVNLAVDNLNIIFDLSASQSNLKSSKRKAKKNGVRGEKHASVYNPCTQTSSVW
jgi:hypothetical protein